MKLLKGCPELKIIELVKRHHLAEECPQKGNCLNEEEMIKEVHEFLIKFKK